MTRTVVPRLASAVVVVGVTLAAAVTPAVARVAPPAPARTQKLTHTSVSDPTGDVSADQQCRAAAIRRRVDISKVQANLLRDGRGERALQVTFHVGSVKGEAYGFQDFYTTKLRVDKGSYTLEAERFKLKGDKTQVDASLLPPQGQYVYKGIYASYDVAHATVLVTWDNPPTSGLVELSSSSTWTTTSRAPQCFAKDHTSSFGPLDFGDLASP